MTSGYRYCLLFCGVAAGPAWGQVGVPAADAAVRPFYFEANQGQAPEDVAFMARARDYVVALTAEGAQVILRSSAPAAPVQITPVREQPGDIYGSVSPVGVDRRRGESHYLIGADVGRWRTHVQHFGAVVYPDVFPGVDMRFHADRGPLEFDFDVAPGARPEQIRLRISGAARGTLNVRGDLVLETVGGDLVLRAPRSFQEIAGALREIPTRFVIGADGVVGFELAVYDRNESLTIDPILDFSTYAGGSAVDVAQAVALDAQGNIYVAGETYSTDLPTHNPYQATAPVNGSAFIMKLDAETRDLVYATYLGSNVTMVRGIAVDQAGAAHIVGDTSSSTFPVVNPYQGQLARLIDIFVSRLSPAGDALTYSTYLGGDQVDRGRAIALDAQGDIYIAGVTSSTDFPLVNPVQTRVRGSTDAYIARLSPARGTLDYSTYLGGGGLDYGTSVAVDAQRGACMSGYTTSVNFPTRNPLQAANGGQDDAVVACFTDQGGLRFSTYLGGAGIDRAHAIRLDIDGDIHLAGETASADFPVAGAWQPTLAGSSDAFAAKLDAAGTALRHATFFGGSGADVAYGLGLDAARNVYLAGVTGSGDFPVRNALQDGRAGGQDAFVAKLEAGAGALGYATWLGGAANDYARALAVDATGKAVVVGATESDDFPLSEPNQPARTGATDGFIAVLSENRDDGFDLTDLLRLARYVAGLVEPSEPDAARVDMNADGRLDVRDLLLLQRDLWMQ